MGYAALAIMAVSMVASASEQSAAADSETASLDLQSKQDTLQYQQKSLNNYDVMNKVLDAQTAQQTVTGTAMGSASSNAIQRSTFNTGASSQRNITLENDINQQNIKNEKSSVNSSLWASLFGMGSSAAMSYASYNNAKPSSASDYSSTKSKG